MVTLNDISELMQKCLHNEIVFMVSKDISGENYNLYFTKHIDKNVTSVRLIYNKDDGLIYKYADENSGFLAFNCIDGVFGAFEYVKNQLEEGGLPFE